MIKVLIILLLTPFTFLYSQVMFYGNFLPNELPRVHTSQFSGIGSLGFNRIGNHYNPRYENLDKPFYVSVNLLANPQSVPSLDANLEKITGISGGSFSVVPDFVFYYQFKNFSVQLNYQNYLNSDFQIQYIDDNLNLKSSYSELQAVISYKLKRLFSFSGGLIFGRYSFNKESGINSATAEGGMFNDVRFLLSGNLNINDVIESYLLYTSPNNETTSNVLYTSDQTDISALGNDNSFVTFPRIIRFGFLYKTSTFLHLSGEMEFQEESISVNYKELTTLHERSTYTKFIVGVTLFYDELSGGISYSHFETHQSNKIASVVNNSNTNYYYQIYEAPEVYMLNLKYDLSNTSILFDYSYSTCKMISENDEMSFNTNLFRLGASYTFN